MSWEQVCTWAGVALLAVGAIMTIWGFLRTWHEFMPGQNLWVDPEWFKRRGEKLTRKTVSAKFGWNILPVTAPRMRTRRAIRELRERVTRLEASLGDVERQGADALGTVHEKIAVMGKQVDLVAVGGLRRQAWGLLLATIGGIVAALPALIHS